ncbi:hypothetical protein, partial [Streptomyces clavuligerus]|uniref:hypothetical protein n=1 Tax=Streptomyces clavuligerus TaxID=1901 RepID=UPI001E53F103
MPGAAARCFRVLRRQGSRAHRGNGLGLVKDVRRAVRPRGVRRTGRGEGLRTDAVAGGRYGLRALGPRLRRCLRGGLGGRG